MSKTRFISNLPDVRAINLWPADGYRRQAAPGMVPPL